MIFSDKVKEYAIKCHQDTNDFYDDYLPYRFHLEMVVANAHIFKHLIPKREEKFIEFFNDIIEFEIIVSACWGHDLIENCRENYSSIRSGIIKQFSGTHLAGHSKHITEFAEDIVNIIYAVSIEKGKNRAERENSKYFAGIRTTHYATFVKLCDRIANIERSKMTSWQSEGKLKMYQKEHARFEEQLYDEQYKEMFDHMQKLFTEK